ncbi:hypothetical protein GLW08_03845 [Pontibacillus yanchengensis]|uniref:Uncharacterized protein n=2 Tax=Pontibacillus yanchengensis TaxID=462910 RepID=A0ACC7VE81_9BACI|nr:hypothetical protein [Pontibacillus yanchengensis]MYL35164.1 hypothetical protein [Pontibacillus yanchengensis]MYL52469.1 hypothetical protein [Pontibacillus yanchengensis]
MSNEREERRQIVIKADRVIIEADNVDVIEDDRRRDDRRRADRRRDRRRNPWGFHRYED